ncbi:MAG: F0F1 ATP synthase subunit gamma, partial [Dongiaceae bacterium]
MPSLKDLRVRINSVKSTQKITSAMKMVAAAKLRRAQEQAEAARPYAERMERMLGSLAASMAGQEGAPALMAGTGKDAVHLVVVMTSDRGLCGGFNSTIVRGARRLIRDLQAAGKQVKVLCVGRKGRDQLRRDFSNLIIGTIEDIAKPRLTFDAADRVARRIAQMFEAGEFDVCTIIYNRFKSAMTQIVTTQQLIPFAPAGGAREPGAIASYEYEPDETVILAELLPRNLSVQI